ncbi:cupin domain-containing protein [Pedobacter aquatilis]|uniref:cupin domain-containing protein n=1 Tax=Pedobacter aquatilis TaxID=351343 RepID=UPI00292E7088|nr:cupin domain-containing protein [Pedobacter aquatilis]
MFKKIPRVVITGEQNGQSKIISDGQAKNVVEHIPGLVISDVWATTEMPASLTQMPEIENTAFPNTPENGTYFRYVSIPPDNTLQVEGNRTGKRHPLFHQTDTLDYIIIASGEIYLVLDDSETLLKAGDIVIQRGTGHAWSNRSDVPCIQLAVLIDASKI